MMRDEINDMKTTILKLTTEDKKTDDLIKSVSTLENDQFIEEFNKLDGEMQNKVIKIKNSNNKNHQFDKISNILTYFSNEIQGSESTNKKIRYIYIPNCHNINVNDENAKECSIVGISSDMIKFLFKNYKLKTEQFKEMISVFSEIYIEIKYPSNIFDSLYGIIVELNESIKSKIKVSIFIAGIDKTDQKFHNNTLIDSVKLDFSVKEIASHGDNGSFEGCSSLTHVIIPSSVNSIGNYAFFQCSSLTHISIPSSIASMGSSIFAECNKLSKISIIPCGEKNIDYFEDQFLIVKTEKANENFDTLIWTKLSVKNVTVPSFIKKIKASGLRGCSSLTQISIPSSVTTIENCAFRGCSSLKQISIPSSVTLIENQVFQDCSSLSKVSFEIPSSITLIQNKTFLRCSALTEITIPSSVSSIGESAFEGCSSLTKVSFEIPSSVTSIGKLAFKGCSSLKQIEVPSSVTSIKNQVFEGCSSLTQITIPSSIDSSSLSIPSTANIKTV